MEEQRGGLGKEKEAEEETDGGVKEDREKGATEEGEKDVREEAGLDPWSATGSVPWWWWLTAATLGPLLLPLRLASLATLLASSLLVARLGLLARPHQGQPLQGWPRLAQVGQTNYHAHISPKLVNFLYCLGMWMGFKAEPNSSLAELLLVLLPPPVSASPPPETGGPEPGPLGDYYRHQGLSYRGQCGHSRHLI